MQMMLKILHGLQGEIKKDRHPIYLLLFTFLLFSIGIGWGGIITRTLIISDLQLGLTGVILGQIGFGLVAVVLAFLLDIGLARIARHTLFIGITIVGLVGLIVSYGLISTIGSNGTLVLYIVFELIVVLWVQHWTHYFLSGADNRVGKQLLPFITTMRLMGLLVGGFTYWLAVTAGGATPENMMVGWLVLMTIISVGVVVIVTQLKRPDMLDERGYESPSQINKGLIEIAHTPFLRWLTSYSMLVQAQIALLVMGLVVWVMQAYPVDAFADGVRYQQAIGIFLSQVDMIGGALLLVIQVVIFPRILKRFGIGNLNLLYPITALMVTIFAIGALISGGSQLLIMAGLAQIQVEPWRRVFGIPVNALLANSVSNLIRARVRWIIQHLLAPFAHALTAFILWVSLFLLDNWQVDFIVLTTLVAVAMVVIAFIIKREYRSAMLKILESEDYTAMLSRDYALGSADIQTLEMVGKRLEASNDESEQILLASIMMEAGGATAVPILLDCIKRTDTPQRRAILKATSEYTIHSPELRMVYVQYVSDSDASLRRSALRGLLNTSSPSDEIRYKIAMDHIHNQDFEVRALMAVVLLESPNPAHRDRAEKVLRALTSDFDPAARSAAAHAYGLSAKPSFIPTLVRLIEDADDDVRLKATQSIDLLWADPIDAEYRQLLHTRQALLLNDPVEQIRLAEMRLLAKIADDTATQTLVRALRDPSPIVREQASQLLIQLGSVGLPQLETAADAGDHVMQKRALLVLVRIDPDRYTAPLLEVIRRLLDDIYYTYTLIAPLEQCSQFQSFFVLIGYFEERIHAYQTDIFEILRAIYGSSAINTIHETLQSNDSRTYLNACAALENITIPELAQSITPLFDRSMSPAKFATLYYNRYQEEPRTAEIIMRDLSSSADSWLRAVGVMALGEVGETSEVLKTLFIEKYAPTYLGESESPCVEAIGVELIAVILKTALSSHDADVRLAAKTAVRMILNQNTLADRLAMNQHKEFEIMLSTIERMIYLKRVPLFEGLSVDQLKAMASICDEKLFKKEETIFKAGDQGGSLFIIVNGSVEVGLGGAQGGGFTRLALYNDMSAFGEMSLFDGQPRSADAVTVTDTLTLTLRREPFLALMRQYPDLSVRLLMILSDRLRKANEQIAGLSDDVPALSNK